MVTECIIFIIYKKGGGEVHKHDKGRLILFSQLDSCSLLMAIIIAQYVIQIICVAMHVYILNTQHNEDHTGTYW